ncbi:MAG TPA: MarR family transcriptional regulator [Chloroflexota bacterium]|nr:MarR family transcriptional regulator [Chloroflexota bacterium]
MSTARSSDQSKLSQSDYRDQADFRYAVRRFVRFSELQARQEGITPQQHLLLLMVRGHESYPRVSIGDIAERLQVRHHSASLLVERMVQRGLVSREIDAADRRRALVALTPTGQDVLDRITIANRRELGELDEQLFRSSFIEALRGTSA